VNVNATHHYQSTHVDTSGMGVSGGMYTAPAGRRRGYPPSMTCAQRDALIMTGGPRPNGFTGLWGDRYYVRGVERPEMRNAGAFGMVRT
jgi:hypothetical protein